MMRSLLYTVSIGAVIGLAFWAYREGYATRATEREVARLEGQIGARMQELSLLRAEWAYLNRPDRLHELTEMNFERLGLVPLAPDHFALAADVGYPPELPERFGLSGRPDAEELEEEVDGVVIMNHRYGADAAPRLIAPPTLPEDGEQLP